MERQKDRLLWIGGQYRQGTAGEFFDSLNPATGQVICRVAVAGAEDVEQAVAAAERGLRQWRALDGTARGRVLMRAAQLLRHAGLHAWLHPRLHAWLQAQPSHLQLRRQSVTARESLGPKCSGRPRLG